MNQRSRLAERGGYVHRAALSKCLGVTSGLRRDHFVMGAPTSDLTRGGDLLAAACAGDAAAFWRLAEGYRPYLRSVAARLLGGRLAGKADASDAVQQGLCAAFEQLPQFGGQGVEQWQGWVLTIVRNEALKLLRYWHQQKRDLRREQPLDAGPGPTAPPAAEDSTPSQRAARREQAARLLAAVERLPPQYREVILLRNFEDLPYADIAARMGRSEDAARQLWERAVRRLREACGDQT
jgi:RNA polymerase sigma-70 factor (ECF subfamily)